MRFNVAPGQSTFRVDDECILIFDHPDDITVPVSISGAEGVHAKVERAYMGPCPRGCTRHMSKTYKLGYVHGGKQLYVSECGDEFVWYTR